MAAEAVVVEVAGGEEVEATTAMIQKILALILFHLLEHPGRGIQH